VAINSNKIKNIIFDLGGVIINIDYALLIEAFSKIGLPHFEAYFSQKEQKKLFDRYEKGMISSQDFRDELKKQCNPGTSDADIDAAWNSMLLDLPKERLDLLLYSKNMYRTFLLSNTNEIHMIFINNYLKKQFEIINLNGHFEKVYLSFEVKMRKPDAEIFELILNQNNLLKEETLFIDDSAQHIDSANKLGISTILLDVQKQSVVDLF
jgi:epoxide hydrolase-like predicted phosphatase